MISPDGRWIFVHIQKTGGNSIRSALESELNDPHKHFLAQELKPLYGEPVWAKTFKFTVVRNPWDRLVSWWSSINNNRDPSGLTPAPNNFFDYVLRRAPTFEDFISRCSDEIVDADGRKCIFRNQLEYLVDENGTVMVDFIGRFERLQDGFDEVTARLGLPPVKLPRTNVSRHSTYTDYYTPAMARKVERVYRRDIETFGYRFGK
jgi:hypothetical protein